MVFWLFLCIQLYFIFISGSRFSGVQVSKVPGFSGSEPKVWLQVLVVGLKKANNFQIAKVQPRGVA